MRLIRGLQLLSGTERTTLKRQKNKLMIKMFIGLSALGKIIKTVLKTVRDRRDVSDNTLDYFLVRFYLLPKIHKRLQNVPGRPVISNSGFHTENISAFLECHLKSLAKNVKYYIKDNNDILRKIASLPPFPDEMFYAL